MEIEGRVKKFRSAIDLRGTGYHVVFRTTGFSVIFDEKETGQDFDGDGKP